MKYNGSSWDSVGSAHFSAEANYLSIAIDGSGTPYVVYEDGSTPDAGATVMKFNGSSWVIVGSAGFSAGGVNWTSIAIDGSGTPYIVYSDSANSYKATAMKFNGTRWVNVGSPGFSANIVKWISIAIDGSGTPYVGYADDTIGGIDDGGKATVMKYNGSSWINVGSPRFSFAAADWPSLAINGSGIPYMAYGDDSFYNNSGGPATVMEFDGSNWTPVGSVNFSAGNTFFTSLAIDSGGTPYVAYEDAANIDMATVMKYNGGNWVNVGSAGFSAGTAYYTTIALNSSGTPYVAYSDGAFNGKASLMTPGAWLGFSNISNPQATTLSAFPNPNAGSFTLILSTPTNEPAQITITNILGEKINEYYIPTNQETTIQLDAPPGVYFLNAVCGDSMQCVKVVVE